MFRFKHVTPAFLLALACTLPVQAQTTAAQWLDKARDCAYKGDEQGVSDACARVVELEPNNVEAWNMRADSNLSWALCNATRAKKYYSQVLALEPKNYHALAFRGFTSTLDNTRASKVDLQNCVEILKALPKRTPEQERVFAMASFWLDPKTSLPVVKRAADLFPEDIECVFFLACALDTAGRTDDAKVCFKKDQILIERELKKHFTGALGRQIVRSCATLQNNSYGIKLLSDYLKDHPNDHNALYYRGYAHALEKQPKAALKDYARSVAAGPTYQLHLMGLADAELAAKHWREAAKIYKQLMEMEPSSEVYINRRAQSLKELHLDKLALQEIEQFLAINPNAYSVWITKAGIEQPETARTDRLIALAKISKAIESTPDIVPLYILRSTLFQGLNEPQKALSDLDQAIRMKPEDAHAYFSRGVLKWNRLNLRDAAIADVNKAIELTSPPVKRSYLLTLSEYYKQIGQYDKAIAAADKYTSLSPDFPEGWRQRAVVHIAQGDPQGALADLQKTLTLRVQLDDVDLMFAKVYVLLNKPNEALTAFNTSLKKDPHCVEALIGRGTLQTKREQYELALLDFNNALLLSPNNPDIYYARFRAYAGMAEYMKAVADISKSMDLSNRNNESWLLEDRARLYTYAERYKDAADDLAKAYRFAMNKPIYLYQRGKLLYWSGNKLGAIESISAYLNLVADPLALRARARCYFETDQLDRSIQDYSALIQGDPENPQLYRLRAKSYAKQGREQLASADLNKAKSLMKSR